VHELSVTESILNTALRYAVKEKALKVTDINLVVGDLSSIIDESVQFYWDILSKETICEKARLHFRHIPASIQCLNCDHKFILQHELIPCPQCSSMNIQILGGDEFKMDSIEIEKEGQKEVAKS
jgi:hydrogenase nickel incorporation protein HypA/HybF